MLGEEEGPRGVWGALKHIAPRWVCSWRNRVVPHSLKLVSNSPTPPQVVPQNSRT